MVGFAMAQVLIALAYLIPALVLLFVLACRRYPGERALLAAMEGWRARRRRKRARSDVYVASLRSILPRGGLLIACALAVRPPPALRLAST
jgi:hypothetical protein